MFTSNALFYADLSKKNWIGSITSYENIVFMFSEVTWSKYAKQWGRCWRKGGVERVIFHRIHYKLSHLSFKRLSIQDCVHIFTVAFYGFCVCVNFDTAPLYGVFSSVEVIGCPIHWNAYTQLLQSLKLVHFKMYLARFRSSICCQCPGFFTQSPFSSHIRHSSRLK